MSTRRIFIRDLFNGFLGRIHHHPFPAIPCGLFFSHTCLSYLITRDWARWFIWAGSARRLKSIYIYVSSGPRAHLTCGPPVLDSLKFSLKMEVCVTLTLIAVVEVDKGRVTSSLTPSYGLLLRVPACNTEEYTMFLRRGGGRREM